MQKKYQIFISSTYRDLIEARQKAIEAILSIYHLPVGMEMFSADDDEQWQVIKDTIEVSDYYVLIIGHRYGSVTQEGISYTEKEFDYAKKMNIPILSFVRSRDISTTKDEREDDPEKIKKLDEFIKKVTDNKMCDFWTSTDELITKITIALTKTFQKKPRTGWVRADNINFSEISDELAKLSKENRHLREEIQSLTMRLNKSRPYLGVLINEKDKIEAQFTEMDNQRNYPKQIHLDDIDEVLKSYITSDQIKEYNKLLPAVETMDIYFRDLELYMRKKTTGYDINLSVFNRGTIKAKEVYIDVIFPSEILVLGKDEVEELKEPIKPELPINPIELAKKAYRKEHPLSVERKSIFENVVGSGSIINYNTPIINYSRFGKLPSINQNYWTKLKDNTITMKLNNILHTRKVEFEDEYCIIPLKSGSYKAHVSIICEEYEEKVTYSIPINIFV